MAPPRFKEKARRQVKGGRISARGGFPVADLEELRPLAECVEQASIGSREPGLAGILEKLIVKRRAAIPVEMRGRLV
jgi:hypothetical protein